MGGYRRTRVGGQSEADLFNKVAFEILARANPFRLGGDEDNDLQHRVTEKLTERLEILLDHIASVVGNGAEVDDPKKARLIRISVKNLSLGGREMANADVRSLGGQEIRNRGQNICMTD